MTYEVAATPILPRKGDALTTQRYTVMLLQTAPQHRPHSEEVEVVGLDGIDAVLNAWGYERAGEFGEVCLNGFALADAKPRA